MERKAVVWIETVLYVLIGLAIIGILLAVMQPKIAETKDKLIVSQTIQSLNTLDETILEVKESTGMRLSYKINLNKGNLVIDSANKKIYWNAITDYQYTEINRTLEEGKIKVFVMPSMDQWNTTLGLDYSAYYVNFTVDGIEAVKTLNPASLPYTIWITNNGIRYGMQQIDFIIG